jgi:hypothetical protein
MRILSLFATSVSTILWSSLTVMHPCREDWGAESSKMGAIYEGAYLTIAAALAPNDEEGFLNPSVSRNTHKSKRLNFNFQGRQITVISTRIPHDSRDQLAKPLATRGWTLQERLLSRRLLTFSSGVTWECPQESWCECGVGLYPNPFATFDRF